MDCLALLKNITVDEWEIRKHNYDSDSVSDL